MPTSASDMAAEAPPGDAVRPEGSASGPHPRRPRLSRRMQHTVLLLTLAATGWAAPWLIRMESSRYELRVRCSDPSLTYVGSVGLFTPDRGMYAWTIYGHGDQTFPMGRGSSAGADVYRQFRHGQLAVELWRDGECSQRVELAAPQTTVRIRE